MTFQLTIDTGNEAFNGEDRDLEVARILRATADRVEQESAGTWRLYDANGNAVGRAKFEDCERDN